MMKITLSKQAILLILALIFLAPGVAAYFFYLHPNWLGTSKVNRGELLTPSVLLPELGQQKKWRIVLWQTASCSQTCIEQLDTLSKVRLALGRRFYEVDLWLLLSSKAPLPDDKSLQTLKPYHMHIKSLSLADTDTLAQSALNNQVFLVNPQGYAVLGYKNASNPNDIFKDLKVLLNTSQS